MKEYLVVYRRTGGYPSKRNIRKYIDELKTIKDVRDKRGRHHKLYFVLCAVSLAILAGRGKLSSIQRYIENRIAWLREVTGEEEAKPISRAQLPRILTTADREAVNKITQKHFGVSLVEGSDGEWAAVDGKTLCGTKDENGNHRVRIITAVEHTSGETIAQAEMSGTKNSEISEVRPFLQQTGLEKKNVTLDALHMNPTTTAQIEQAGGHYIIQTKQNQPTLYDSLTTIANTQSPLAILNTNEVGHGRHEERWAWLFNIAEQPFDSRWQQSGFRSLVVVLRQTTLNRTQKISLDLSFYLSNCSLVGENKVQPDTLFHAIRRHWGVESSNWIRDVTFQEDRCITKDVNLAQLLASLRTFAIRLLERADFSNFQATLERFSDCPHDFLSFLNDSHFL